MLRCFGEYCRYAALSLTLNNDDIRIGVSSRFCLRTGKYDAICPAEGVPMPSGRWQGRFSLLSCSRKPTE